MGRKTIVQSGGTNALFSFLAGSNHTYTVRCRAALESGSWTNLVHMPAAAANREVELTTDATVTKRYYET